VFETFDYLNLLIDIQLSNVEKFGTSILNRNNNKANCYKMTIRPTCSQSTGASSNV